MRNPFTNVYRDFEKKQIRHVQDCYRRHIKEKLHAFLEMDDNCNRPKHIPIPRSFEKATWLDGLGRNFFHEVAKAMIMAICEYQTERSRRTSLASGYVDDPTNLFLEEFKDWCKTLSQGDASRDRSSELEQRTAYLNSVIDATIFPQGRLGSGTFLEVLIGLTKTLKAAKLSCDDAVRRQAARDILKELRDKSHSAYVAGVQYLYHVFRNTTNTPGNCDLQRISEPDQAMQRIIATDSGYYLQQLVQLSKHLQQAAIVAASPVEAPDESSPTIFTENAFFTGTLSGSNRLTESTSSGIAPAFRQKNIVAEYIRLHGLLHELAKIKTMTEAAYDLAGEGGNLLIYGEARDYITRLLQVYTALPAAITSTINQLEGVAQTHRATEFSARKANSAWSKNYQESSQHRREIQHALAGCADAAEAMQTKMHELTLAERLAETERKLHQFMSDVECFTNYLSGALQFEPHSIPKIIPPPRQIGGVAASRAAPKPEQHLPPATVADKRQPAVSVPTLPVGDPRFLRGQVVGNELRFFGEQMSDNVLAIILRSFTASITKIELQKNRISSVGALTLFEMMANFAQTEGSEVEHVNLWRNQLGDKGAIAISAYLPQCRIKTLIVNENEITALGARTLAMAMAYNPDLEKIDIGYNTIGDKGAEAFATCLLGREKPFNLHIGGNGITDKGGQALLTLAQQNHCLIGIELNGNVLSEALQQTIEAQVARNQAQQAAASNIPQTTPPTLTAAQAVASAAVTHWQQTPAVSPRSPAPELPSPAPS